MENLALQGLKLRPAYRLPVRSIAIAVACLLLAALLVSTRDACRTLSSEEFVLVMSSLWETTLYYPGSNRNGNLTPIVASFIESPTLNAWLQNFLRATFGFLAFFFGLSYFVRHGRTFTLLLLLVILVMVQFEYGALYVLFFGAHPYSASLALFLAAALLLERSQQLPGWKGAVVAVVAFALMLIAFWTNLSLIILLSAYAGIYILLGARRELGWLRSCLRAMRRVKGSALHRLSMAASFLQDRRGLLTLTLAAPAFMVNYTASIIYARIFPELNRSFSSDSYAAINLSVENVVVATRNLSDMLEPRAFPWEFLATLAAVSIHVALAYRARRRGAAPPAAPIRLRIAASLLVAAALSIAVTAQIEHVGNNDFNFRYFIPSGLVVLLLTVAYGAALPAFLFARLWRNPADSLPSTTSLQIFPSLSRLWESGAKYVAPLLVCSAVLVIVARFGMPAPGCTFDRPGNEATITARQVLEDGYSGVLGSYWDLWPVVFQAARLSYEQGEPAHVFPTGYRSEVFNRVIQAKLDSVLRAGASYRLLCLHEGKTGTEFGTIDCAQLLTWNRSWGSLPPIGEVRVDPAPPAADARAVTVSVPSLELGTNVSLRAADQPGQFLSGGWYPSERSGTWTKGERSDITVRLERPAGRDLLFTAEIAATVAAMAANPPPMRVRVLVNDAPVADWEFKPGKPVGQRPVLLPSALLDRSVMTFISLQIDRPRTPRELGFNQDDERQLGLALQALRFDVAP